MSGRLAATLLLLLCVLQLACCLSSDWSPQTYPNPAVDLDKCGRKGVRSWVCDPDGVLSYESANVVEGVLRDIAAGADPYVRKPCGDLGPVGYQVAVALMQRMQLSEGQSAPAQASVFAERLHNAWGVGSSQCHNGVLLLLSTHDRQVYVTTGAGAKDALPTSKIERIIAAMRGPLRAGNYDGALEQAAVDIGLSLAGGEGPKGGGGDEEDEGWWNWPLAIFAAFAGLWGWTAWKGRARTTEYKKCKALLEKLKAEQQQAFEGHSFPTASCPVCLEDFAPAAKPPQAAASRAASSQQDNAAGGGSKGGGAIGSESDALLQGNEGGASRGKNSAGGVDGAGKKKPLILPCGHSFCEPCISQWMEGHSSCPICRRNLTVADNAPPPQPACVSDVTARQQWTTDAYADEFEFRLRNAQRLYPVYITDPMVHRWSQQVRQGSGFDFHATREFQAHDPAVRAAHAHAGSLGASTSFGGGGGGYSMGGGGHGGTW